MANPAISRRQILAFRQRASHLHERLPRSQLVEAAFAGLQDSSPRSALLSLHARVHDVSASDWEDPKLVQIWGPRGADYVVPRRDVGVFTLGRLPRAKDQREAVELAMGRVAKILSRAESQKGLAPSNASKEHLRDLRVASISGRLRIRWDGSRISWWIVDSPSTDPESARLELARRFLRCLGPSTPKSFSWWSGVPLLDAQQTFRSLEKELTEVKMKSGGAWVLKPDQDILEQASMPHTVRMLPPGDPFLGSPDRDRLVQDRRLRAELWPKSVRPGALFVHGELEGTWRRQQGRVTIQPWRKLSSEVLQAVADEVQAMPIESMKEAFWEARLKVQ